MRTHVLAVTFASLAALALSLGACGKSAKPLSVMPTDCPEWVFRGSGAMEDAGKKAFYGVGAVRGIKNKSLAMSTADNRARAEIGRTLKTYSASLMKDYMASTTAGGDASAEEQHVEQAIKTFSATTMTGVQIVEHWIGPDETIYALARIDFDDVKASLAKTAEFAPVAAKADEGYDKVATPPPPPPPPPAPEGPQMCQLEMRVQQVGRSSEGCYVDEQVAHTIGLFTYPCEGGEATVVFGSVKFTGTVTAEAVALNMRTEYTYERYDPCKWWSEQKMTGTLAAGKLRYEYVEGRVDGQSGCNMNAIPCTADGDVFLRQSKVPAAQ